MADIQRAASGQGNALGEQQLSRSNIPIIVDSCIAFITQHGENGSAGVGRGRWRRVLSSSCLLRSGP